MEKIEPISREEFTSELAGKQSRYKTVAALVATETSPGSGVYNLVIDCSSSTDVYQHSLTQNIAGWTFNNLPASGKCLDIEVQITQHASAAKTCVDPGTAGKTAGDWTMSTTTSAVEVLGLRIFSDGTVHNFPSAVFA